MARASWPALSGTKQTAHAPRGRPSADEPTGRAGPRQPPGTSQPGEYQLDIHLEKGSTTREPIPETDLEAAQIWAQGRIDAEGANFGAIYFPAGGSGEPGTGALECSYDRAVGWYR